MHSKYYCFFSAVKFMETKYVMNNLYLLEIIIALL